MTWAEGRGFNTLSHPGVLWVPLCSSLHCCQSDLSRIYLWWCNSSASLVDAHYLKEKVYIPASHLPFLFQSWFSNSVSLSHSQKLCSSFATFCSYSHLLCYSIRHPFAHSTFSRMPFTLSLCSLSLQIQPYLCSISWASHIQLFSPLCLHCALFTSPVELVNDTLLFSFLSISTPTRIHDSLFYLYFQLLPG